MQTALRLRIGVLAGGISLLVAVLLLARSSTRIADHAGLAIAILSLLTGLTCSLTFSGRARRILAIAACAAGVLALLWPSSWLLFAPAVALAWLLAALGMPMLVWRRNARVPVAATGVAATVLACGSVALVASGVPALMTPALPDASASTEVQLRHLASMDQADRRGAAMLLHGSRDRRRLQRVLQLDAAGEIREPRVAADAALVLLHGRCPAHFNRAAQLFAMAADAGVEGAEEGHRASVDRHLLSIGLPQQHGTQRAQSVESSC